MADKDSMWEGQAKRIQELWYIHVGNVEVWCSSGEWNSKNGSMSCNNIKFAIMRESPPPLYSGTCTTEYLCCLLSVHSTVLLSLLSDLLRSSCTSQQQMIQCQGFLVISHVLEKVHMLICMTNSLL